MGFCISNFIRENFMEIRPDVTEEIKPLVAAGKLFCFSEGEYSDYGYVGHFLALEPITKDTFEKVKERCMERIKNGEGKCYGDPVGPEAEEYEIQHAMRDLFLPELVRMGVVMDIDCATIHIGSYGRLDL
jgi:hypothetical protein